MLNISNPKEFKNEVENSTGIVIVDFFATWCGPCKMLAPVFEETSKDMKDKAKFVKVDIDEGLELAKKYNVNTVPTVMIFKDGKLVDSMVGFVPKKNLTTKVRNYL